MTQTIGATYTNGVLKPTAELPLRDNQRVRLSIEAIDETSDETRIGSRGCRHTPEGRDREHAFLLGGTASQPRGTA